jgi:hypothetical protein
MGSGSLVANAGTPLMWGSFFMLLFGNLLIAQLEHRLITGNWTKSSLAWTPTIPANYISMLAGIVALYFAAPIFEPIYRQPLKYGLAFVVGAWLLAYLITVIIELPFVAKTAGIKIGAKAIRTTLGVHLISYGILILIVHFLGSISALTGLRQVELHSMETDPGWIYYLDAEKAICRIRLDGTNKQAIKSAAFSDPIGWTRVTVEPTEKGDCARLLLRNTQSATVVIDENVGAANRTAPVETFTADGFAELGNLTFAHFSTRKFISGASVYAGFWPREGLVIGDSRFALETPFIAMSWRSPVVLPDGKVVAQFGDAIYLIDPSKGKVAFLVRGSGGDVLLDAPPGS